MFKGIFSELKLIKSYIRLARLNNLTGFFLTFLPAYWGLVAGWHESSITNQMLDISFANGGKYFYILLIGALLARSAGCILNDITDVEFDRKTTRTYLRPIANGDLSKKQAYGFLLFIGTLAMPLLCYLPTNAIIVCLASLPLMAIYPYAKRFSPFPQLFLGLVFNLGLFVGYLCFNKTIPNRAIFLLYGVAVCWTFIYDTIYAMQDVKDDIRNDVKSSAVTLGNSSYKVLYVIAIIITLSLISYGKISGYCNNYFTYCGLTSMFLLTILTLNKNKLISHKTFFNLSTTVGLGVAIAISLAKNCFLVVI